MCGIVSLIKRKDDGVSTNKTILGMFKSQKERGTEGLGFVSFDEIITSYQRRETEIEIERVLDKIESRSIMFHHRLPTSTPNFADCTHPIKVSHKELKHDYYLIHNGIISNDSILHDKHIEAGYEYTTRIVNKTITQNRVVESEKWNDSEALAINVARFIENVDDKIECRGSIAFVCLQVNKKTQAVLRVFWGRNTSPLSISFTENNLVLRSIGEKEIVEPNMLYALDLKTWKIEEAEVNIGELVTTRQRWDNNTYNDYERDQDNRCGYGIDDYDVPPFNTRIHKQYNKEIKVYGDEELVRSLEEDNRENEIADLEDRIDILQDNMDLEKDNIMMFKESGDLLQEEESVKSYKVYKEEKEQLEEILDMMLSGEIE